MLQTCGYHDGNTRNVSLATTCINKGKEIKGSGLSRPVCIPNRMEPITPEGGSSSCAGLLVASVAARFRLLCICSRQACWRSQRFENG